MPHRIFKGFSLLVASALIWTGCTFDNEEEFFAVTDPCDTTLVSYAAHIAPIMEASCNSCHGLFPSGGVTTNTYAGLAAVAASGKLKGAVNHLPGYQAMPPSQPKLDTCSLKKINAWINQGFPNN